MAETKFKISSYTSELGNSQPGLYISSKLLEKLNLKSGSNIVLEFGANSISATIFTASHVSTDEKTLWITPDAMQELLLPDNIEIRVESLRNPNVIKIGPTIGVLTENYIMEDFRNGRKTREAFHHYADAVSNIGGLAFIFSPADVDIRNKRINGYVPIMNNSRIINWQNFWLPLPDAIHNRVKLSPSDVQYKKLEDITSLFPKVIIMNRITKIYKWRMHTILEKNKQARKYLPKTLLYRGQSTVAKMLDEFPVVYLKPVGRSLGAGVVQIARIDSGRYTARYQQRGKKHSIISTLSEILTKLKPLMGKRSYIVQQGIPLATYKGNIFDLRVSVQKDGTGCWSITRCKARVASPGNIVTNLSAGGYGTHMEQAIEYAFKDKAEEIKNEIMSASLTICKAIEAEISGIGDIGMDIGISKDGKVYFIEANFRELRLNSGAGEDLKNWSSTFKKPIYYLNYLYNKQLQKYSV